MGGWGSSQGSRGSVRAVRPTPLLVVFLAFLMILPAVTMGYTGPDAPANAPPENPEVEASEGEEEGAGTGNAQTGDEPGSQGASEQWNGTPGGSPAIGSVTHPSGSSFLGVGAPWFEPNEGRFDERVLFYSKAGRDHLFALQDRLVLVMALPGTEITGDEPEDDTCADGFPEEGPCDGMPGRYLAIHAALEGPAPPGPPAPENPLPGNLTQIRGEEGGWSSQEIPRYQRLVYEEAWPGTDLVLRTNPEGDWAYDLHLSSSADLDQVRFDIQGPESMRIGSQGELLLLADGEVLEHGAPIPVDPRGEVRHDVEVGYRLLGEGVLGFTAEGWDGGEPLVIDPPIFTTLFIHEATGHVTDLEVASDGSTYITGTTVSSDFPTTPGVIGPEILGPRDGFAAKLDPFGRVRYATYLGGSGWDFSNGLDLAPDGAIVIVGHSNSVDLPVTLDAPQPYHPAPDEDVGRWTGFILVLDRSASRLKFGSYVGGSGFDALEDVAASGTGIYHVVGRTNSGDIPTTPDAFRPDPPSGEANPPGASFAAGLEQGRGELVYGTFLAARSVAQAVGLDTAEKPVISGYVNSGDLPTTEDAFQTTKAKRTDLFALGLTQEDGQLRFSTYIGGDEHDPSIGGLQLGPEDQIFIAANTMSDDFPGTDAKPGERDVVVLELDPLASQLRWARMIGGGGYEHVRGVALGPDGTVVVVGSTRSPDFPTTPDALQSEMLRPKPPNVGFITVVDTKARDIVYSSYFGGTFRGTGLHAAGWGPDGGLLAAGRSGARDLPLTGGPAPSTGHSFTFVARLLLEPDPVRTLTARYQPSATAPETGQALLSWEPPVGALGTVGEQGRYMIERETLLTGEIRCLVSQTTGFWTTEPRGRGGCPTVHAPRGAPVVARDSSLSPPQVYVYTVYPVSQLGLPGTPSRILLWATAEEPEETLPPVTPTLCAGAQCQPLVPEVARPADLDLDGEEDTEVTLHIGVGVRAYNPWHELHEQILPQQIVDEVTSSPRNPCRSLPREVPTDWTPPCSVLFNQDPEGLAIGLEFEPIEDGPVDVQATVRFMDTSATLLIPELSAPLEVEIAGLPIPDPGPAHGLAPRLEAGVQRPADHELRVKLTDEHVENYRIGLGVTMPGARIGADLRTPDRFPIGVSHVPTSVWFNRTHEGGATGDAWTSTEVSAGSRVLGLLATVEVPAEPREGDEEAAHGQHRLDVDLPLLRAWRADGEPTTVRYASSDEDAAHGSVAWRLAQRTEHGRLVFATSTPREVQASEVTVDNLAPEGRIAFEPTPGDPNRGTRTEGLSVSLNASAATGRASVFHRQEGREPGAVDGWASDGGTASLTLRGIPAQLLIDALMEETQAGPYTNVSLEAPTNDDARVLGVEVGAWGPPSRRATDFFKVATGPLPKTLDLSVHAHQGACTGDPPVPQQRWGPGGAAPSTWVQVEKADPAPSLRLAGHLLLDARLESPPENLAVALTSCDPEPEHPGGSASAFQAAYMANQAPGTILVDAEVAKGTFPDLASIPDGASTHLRALIDTPPRAAALAVETSSDQGEGRNESFQAQVQTRGDHADGAGIFLDIEPGESPSAIADHSIDLDGVAGNVSLLFEQERATPPEECPWTVPRHKRHLVVDAGQTLVPLDARYEQRGTGGGAYLWGCESMETWPQLVKITARELTGRVEMLKAEGEVAFPSRGAGELRLETKSCESYDFETCKFLGLIDTHWTAGWMVFFKLVGGTSERAFPPPGTIWPVPLSLCLENLRVWIDLSVSTDTEFIPGDEEVPCY